MYALVRDGSLVAVRGPGIVEYKLLDGAPLRPPDSGWTEALANACGFYKVVDPGAPTVTATQVVESTVELVDGVPTRIYAVRDKLQGELNVEAALAAAQTERDQAKAAIADLDTFLALQSPTNAQTLAVVRLLCRIEKRLIRDAFR